MKQSFSNIRIQSSYTITKNTFAFLVTHSKFPILLSNMIIYIFYLKCFSGGLLWWLSDKESVCQYRRLRRHRFDTWVGKIPWRRKWQLTVVFLCGKFCGQRSLAGYSPWGLKRVGHDLATKKTDQCMKKVVDNVKKKKKDVSVASHCLQDATQMLRALLLKLLKHI